MRRGACLTAFFLCLLSAPQHLSAADESKKNRGDRQNSRAALADGEHCLRNSEYACAEEKFKRYIELEPSDAVGNLRLAATYYFDWTFRYKSMTPKVIDNKNDKERYKAFVAVIKEGIAKTKTGTRSDGIDNAFLAANLFSFWGSMQVKNESYGAAADTAREVVKLAEASRCQEAKFLLGLMNYEMNQRIPSILFYIRPFKYYLREIPHDRKKGLMLLAEAASSNTGPFAEDIWLVILRILTEMKNAERVEYEKTLKVSAGELFRRLGEEYPKNDFIVRCRKSRRF